MQWPKNIRP